MLYNYIHHLFVVVGPNLLERNEYGDSLTIYLRKLGRPITKYHLSMCEIHFSQSFLP